MRLTVGIEGLYISSTQGSNLHRVWWEEFVENEPKSQALLIKMFKLKT